MRRETAWVGLLVVLFVFLFVLQPLPVHAAATLVQQNNNGVNSTSNPEVVTVTLNSVTSGDVIVVGLEISACCSVMSVTDSLGSTFTQAVTTGSGFEFAAAIWTTTLSSGCAGSGCYTVTAKFNNALAPEDGGFCNAYVYDVAGVTTTGLTTGTGTGTSTSISTSAVSFTTGAFLLGMIAHDSGTVTQGSGFTLSTENSGQGVSNGQWSDPVSSPTTFPASVSSSVAWRGAGLALKPAPTPPIPEYPYGLTMLAIFMALAYAVIKRRTVTRN